jgi:DNA-binding MarR family transcriptional regulator
MPGPYYTHESLDANNSVGFLIKRCGVLMTQIAERRFDSQPINFTRWTILMRLTQGMHASPTELSADLGYDMGALTRVVDDLVRKDLVRRERSEHDRRAVEIAVTPEGRRLALAGKRFVVDLLNELVEPYSKTEIEGLIAILQGLLVRMQKAAARPATPAEAEEAASRPRTKRGAPRAGAKGSRTAHREPRRKPLE